MYYGSKLFGLVDNSFLATFGNGRLYNWYAVSDPKGLAPAGWKVPNQAEFNTLVTTLGGLSVAGGKLKSTRTGLNPGFNEPNTGATNESGFNALGAGIRLQNGTFTVPLQYLICWAITGYDINNAYYFTVYNTSATAQVGFIFKNRGNSVRCLKIDTANWYPGMVVTDIDGNIYNTVKIGTQVWMQSNLKTTKFADGTDIPLVTGNTDWAALTTPGQCTYNNSAISEYTELITL